MKSKIIAVFMLCLIALAGSMPVQSASIVRGPYVENADNDTITVRFRTDASTVAWVSYGAYPDCERFLTISAEVKEHRLPLFGLLPDTTHCYRIYVPDTVSTGVVKAAESTFRTFRGEDKPYLNFLAFGDSGSASGSEEQLEIAKRMEEFDPDFILHTGDILEAGLDSEADEQYFTPYKNIIAKYPVFIALGNHEYGKKYNKAGNKRFLRDNYSLFHSMPFTGVPPYYYFFDQGNARFFVLDTNFFYGAKWAQPLTEGSKQYNWLEHFLSKTRQTWKFVVVHQPVYSSGAHGGIDEETSALAPLFEKYGVDIVFQGHDHNYERTKPIKEGAVNDAKGVVYITLGGGGSPLYFQRDNPAWTETYMPVYHFANFDIKGSNLKMQVYDKDDKVIDTLEIQK